MDDMVCMLLAMADARAVLGKLADRLQHMHGMIAALAAEQVRDRDGRPL